MTRPAWRNGRRSGLKIRSQLAWGFESPGGHVGCNRLSPYHDKLNTALLVPARQLAQSSAWVLTSPPRSKEEATNDHRNAHLHIEAGQHPDIRGTLRRRTRHPAEILQAGRVLAHRGRPAEPGHPRMALRVARRTCTRARRSVEGGRLAAEHA